MKKSSPLRTVGFVLLGYLAGSVVNMSFVMLSGHVIPPPPGADMTTMEGLKNAIPLFEPKHFLFPFLAHALGTLAGAAVAARLTRSQKAALAVGGLFLIGGVANVFMLGGPVWFIALDLVVAYLPMAWIGWSISGRRK